MSSTPALASRTNRLRLSGWARRDDIKSGIALAGIVLLAIAISPLASDGSRIFLELGNLTDILRQISVIGIISLAMTLVILTGGIDLSVGSILALSTSLVAMGLTRAWLQYGYSVHMLYAIAACLAACMLVGAVNGIAIAVLEIQPFIVTLASMIGVRGLAKWLSGNANIDIGFGQDVAAHFASVFRQKGLVIGSYIGLAVLFWILLGRTVFGRHVRAIGDNETAARYAGCPCAGSRRLCIRFRGSCRATRAFSMLPRTIKEIRTRALRTNWMRSPRLSSAERGCPEGAAP